MKQYVADSLQRHDGPGSVHTTKRLAWPLMVVPGLLVLIYAMLSFLALADQAFFYESMEIPTPDNEFLLWSWGGKNTAMVAVLAIATFTRLRLLVVTALVMLFVGQVGDLNAGAQSGTSVFVTWLALTLVVVEVGLLWLDHRRNSAG